EQADRLGRAKLGRDAELFHGLSHRSQSEKPEVAVPEVRAKPAASRNIWADTGHVDVEHHEVSCSRRAFLRFVASSPLFAGMPPISRAVFQQPEDFVISDPARFQGSRFGCTCHFGRPYMWGVSVFAQAGVEKD